MVLHLPFGPVLRPGVIWRRSQSTVGAAAAALRGEGPLTTSAVFFSVGQIEHRSGPDIRAITDLFVLVNLRFPAVLSLLVDDICSLALMMR